MSDEDRPGDPGEKSTPAPDPVTSDKSKSPGEVSDLPDLDDLPGGARAALEAVLMVVEHPVEEVQLAAAMGVTVERVTELLAGLVAEYDNDARGFELRRVAGGWRVYSRAEFSPVLERFVLDGQTSKLSQAALETLAIVAYRQPVSRARVSAIRGVNVDAVMRTLVTRGLVEDSGNDPETGATLYQTTQTFLHKLGLTSLDALPALAPFLPEVDALDDFPAGVS
ncbi:SMC-Scp complex subunit ScpB [Kineosporia mesophila]|uniref:SMC-Scp complex subunit ScpB n=1 Tax=Kineosporia mesophila TaxID=566012 RepID=A0ABP6ZWX7_9ACTN|nr:SMC-Scp complex subunit ScpB [Kineosporia mesophila]